MESSGSQDRGAGGGEGQTVQSVQCKRHPVTGLSGPHSEQILREEQPGHVKLLYILNEGAMQYNFTQTFYTELCISKKYAFYLWSSVASCVIAPPKFCNASELTVVFMAVIVSNMAIVGGIMALWCTLGGTFGYSKY